jgi:hypothetical protein
MSDKYLVVGDHADTLASGRPIAPGETLPASAVNPKDPNDQRLLDGGVLIDTGARKGSTEEKSQ